MEYDDCDQIRPPDDVYLDRLAGNTYDDDELVNILRSSAAEATNTDERNMMALSEKELDDVLEKSWLEYEAQMHWALELAQKKDIEERKLRFANAKSQIVRLHRIDKDHAEIYSVLLNGIHLFEEDGVGNFPLGNTSIYETIQGVVKTLRITAPERDDLLAYFLP